MLPVVALTCVLISACASGQSASRIETIEPGTLTVCLYPGFAPFAVKGADGAWTGWDVDYLQDFAARQSLELKIVDIAQFKDIWMRPGNGECDIAGTGITRLSDRAEQTGEDGSWSATYYSVARGLAVPEGVTVSGIEDLAGQTVITTKGATADVDLLARIAQSGVDVRVEYVDGQDIGAQRVIDGDAIAFAEGVGSIETLAKDFPGLQLAWEHCLMLPDGTISSEPFGFVVRTASSGLLPALDSFIADSGVAYPGGPGSGRDCPTGE